MANIAVTGATGFVGRELVSQLISEGHSLRCWKRKNSLAQDSDSIRWITGELGDQAAVEALVDGCEAVVHSGIWRSTASFQGPEPDIVEYAQRNVIGSLQLIDFAFKSGVKKFIYLSSCAVHEKILDDRPLDEAHPLWAGNHYGAHKAAIEKFVHSYGLGRQFQIAALRPTAIYGIDLPIEKSRWFNLAKEIVDGKDVNVSGGGKLVHVLDVVTAIRLLLDHNEIAGQSYSLCERYFPNIDIARRLAALAESDSIVTGTAGSPKHVIDTGKLKRMGMEYGGDEQLEQTLRNLVLAARDY